MTSSLLAARHGAQTPRVSTHPPFLTSAGEDALDLAESVGLVALPWQRYVVTQALGERENGNWASKNVSVWVPRQNGKGALIEIRVLAGLFLFGEKLILWSAHEYKTAQEGFLRIKELIQNAPDLDRLVARYWQANGEQGIELRTGQRLRFVARSGGSGRGFTGDMIILDEAQFLQLAQIKALYPTLASKPNSQVWFLGTPPEDPAAWVYGLRERGEQGEPRLAHFDWGQELDLDDPELLAKMADRDRWYAANPSLGSLLSEEGCADELTALREGFASERLGVWLPKAVAGAGVISTQLWADLAVTPERPTDRAFAVVVNAKRTHTAIVAVGPRADGRMQASVVDYRRGTEWVPDRMAELNERWHPVAFAVQDKGPTGSLLPDINKAGLAEPEDRERPQRGDLATPWAADVAAAYGMLVDAAHQRRLVHVDDAPLNTAVARAETRPLGGGTTWDYKSDVDVAPLQGITLALWAYVTRVDLVSPDRDPIGVW